MKRYRKGVTVEEVPVGITRLVQKRAEQLLPALAFHNYDLKQALGHAYFQGIKDGLDAVASAEHRALTMEEALRDNG